jgi:hypothetical protein
VPRPKWQVFICTEGSSPLQVGGSGRIVFSRVDFVAFAAQMVAELETHLIERQIPFATGHLKQAKI